MYDLTFLRCPFGEVENVGEPVLGVGGLGEHAACFGPSAGRGVDQDGFLDSGELVEQLPDGEVQAGVFYVAAHEVGDLQGEDAGEGVHADIVFGPVVHGRERNDMGVFELPEAVLRIGLGPVGGDDVGDRPVVVGGDQVYVAFAIGLYSRAIVDWEASTVKDTATSATSRPRNTSRPTTLDLSAHQPVTPPTKRRHETRDGSNRHCVRMDARKGDRGRPSNSLARLLVVLS